METENRFVRVEREAFLVVMCERADDLGRVEAFREAMVFYKAARAEMEVCYARDDAADMVPGISRKSGKHLTKALHDWRAAAWRLSHTPAASFGDVLDLLREAGKISAMKGLDDPEMGATEFAFLANAVQSVEHMWRDLHAAWRNVGAGQDSQPGKTSDRMVPREAGQ